MSILKRMKGIAIISLFFISVVIFFIGVKRSNLASVLSRSYLTKYKYVIHIVIDGLSADHLGCYGYDIPTSPTIDRLAGENSVFKNAICQKTNTLASLISVFTSTYPVTNGFRRNGIRALVPLRALPEFLAEKGYKIFYIESNKRDKLLNPTFRNLFEKHRILKHKTQKEFGDYDTVISAMGDASVTDKVLEVIEKERDFPFYLFIIYNEVHNFRGRYNKLSAEFKDYYDLFVDKDYNGSLKTEVAFNPEEKNLNEEDKKYARAHYDAKIRFVDDQIKRIVDKLKDMGMWGNVVFVIHADHGDNIYDYDLSNGSHTRHLHRTLYDKGIRIPLIIKIPGYASKVIEEQVENIDLVPTLIDMIGLSFSKRINKKSEGTSLLPLISGDKGNFNKKYAFSEGGYWAYVISIRSNRWKYISVQDSYVGGGWILYERDELYDLERDPHERKDMVSLNPDIKENLKKIVSDWYKKKKAGGYDFSDQIPYDVKEFMEATGYTH